MSPVKPGSALSGGLWEIVLAVLVWGWMPFVIQIAAQEMPAAQMVAVRLLLAGGALTVVVGPRALLSLLNRHRRLFTVLALVGFTLPHLFYVYALRSVPIPVLTFISNSYPALAILLAVLVLREKPSIWHLVGITSALAGLYLLAGAALRLGPGALWGVLFALAGSIGWAIAAVVGKKLTHSLRPLEITAGRHLAAGVFALPLVAVEGVQVRGISTEAWLATGLLAVMSVAAFGLYYRGLRKTSVSTASVLESFTPVTTLIIAVLFFHEALDLTRLAGAALVLGGTLLVTLQHPAQRAAAPEEAAPASLPAAD